MSEVYITRIAKFLPNAPIPNEELEHYLGYINGKPSKSKAIVLRNNKIKSRYYALDKSGVSTHANAEMASLAIKGLFNENEQGLKEVDLLSCATSSPDQLMPSHGAMVHGYLPETGNIEVVSPSGVCCAGMHAFKYAYMAIKLGERTKAVSSGSEKFSISLRSEQFEDEVQKLIQLEQNPILAFDKDFLRWMLSDGAGAFLIENKPNPEGISLRVDWIHGFSFANTEEPCMYMGAEKRPDGTLKSYKDFSMEEVLFGSVLSIKQDVRLLNEKIYSLGIDKMLEIFEKNNIKPEDFQYFLPHLSSYYFQDKMAAYLKEKGFEIPTEKWFTNLGTVGNIGSASIYLILEELFYSGRLKKGEKIILGVPESSRFSYVYSMLTVV